MRHSFFVYDSLIVFERQLISNMDLGEKSSSHVEYVDGGIAAIVHSRLRNLHIP